MLGTAQEDPSGFACTALMEAVREEGPESLAVRDLMDCVRMIKEHVNVLVKRVNRYRSPLSWDKDSDMKLRHDGETLHSQMADLDNTVAKFRRGRLCV